MATSRPRNAHLKEKSTSASDTLHGRRTTKPLVPGYPDRDPLRKPTATSSSTTGISRGRSQASPSATTGTRIPTKKPIAKTSSPSPKERRTPSSSSLLRAAISSKPASDKASKPLRNTKTPPLLRAKSLGAATKKVVVATPTPTEPPPVMKSEQEEQPQIQVAVSKPVDVLAVKDDVPDELDLADSSAPNIPEDTADSASQTEQQEPNSPKTEPETAANDDGVGGDEMRVDEDKESPKKPEEKPVMDGSEGSKSEPVVESGEPEEAEEAKATTVESSERNRPEVVAFKKPEAASTGWKFPKDGPKSNDVIEEARSKLMGKRKSKVLALVGAFETVISLQDSEGQSSQTSQSGQIQGEEVAEEGSTATKESTEST